MRRYRDMFQAVQHANAHFKTFFAGLGLHQVSDSPIELKWAGTIDGRNLAISLSNGGRWEVSISHLTVTVATSAQALLALGESVPPLRRVGMARLASPRSEITAFAHDPAWGARLLASAPASALMARLCDGQFLTIEPGRITWIGEIGGESDAAVAALPPQLAALAKAAEQGPPALPVADSAIRRHAPAIAIGLGVLFLALLGLGFALLAMVF